MSRSAALMAEDDRRVHSLEFALDHIVTVTRPLDYLFILLLQRHYTVTDGTLPPIHKASRIDAEACTAGMFKFHNIAMVGAASRVSLR